MGRDFVVVSCEALLPEAAHLTRTGATVVTHPCRHVQFDGDVRDERPHAPSIDPPNALATYLTGCCLPARREGTAISLVVAADCVTLLTGRALAAHLGPDAFVVTPGWLLAWEVRGHPNARADARGVPRGNGSQRCVLLDTGASSNSEMRLGAFAAATGMPRERLAVGTDLVDATLGRLRAEATLAAARRDHEAEAAALRDQATTAATALDVFSQMSGLSNEETAAASVLDLFGMLFAARLIKLSVVGRFGQRARTWTSVNRGADVPVAPVEMETQDEFEWTSGGRGFRIRLSLHGRELGLLEVDDLALPEHREQYLNIAIPVARACGMAIANARALQGFVTLCAECHRIKDVKGAWQQLESYLTGHHDVEFSHSICPECMHRLYPNFVDRG